MTTWNPSDKSANITLSGGNLTVTCTSNVDGGVRSTISKSTGKVYFEYICTTFNATGGDTGCGIATSSAVLTSIGAVGVGGVITFPSGNTYFNGTNRFSLGIINNGNILCVAIDITNNLYWIRNGTGNWNGSSTANPATGTGGLDVSGLFSTNAVFACICENSTLANISVNFGATAFVQTVPSGFAAWDPAVIAAAFALHPFV